MTTNLIEILDQLPVEELDNRTENLFTEEQIMEMVKEIINKQNPK